MSATTMRRVRLSGNRQADVEEVAVPEPHGDQVVVRVRASALCGSDLHGLYRPEQGSRFTPGHEIAGEVVATDQAVRAGWATGWRCTLPLAAANVRSAVGGP